MWDFIRECLRKHPYSIIKDDSNTFFYEQLLYMVELHGNTLKSVLKPKSKCAVLCDSGLESVIGLLSCWSAGMVAIPLSKNYGTKHCEQIIALTDPDAVIIDDDNYKYKFTYNLNSNLFYGELTNIRIDPILYDVALIMCTSGTTGKPKGAMITEDGLKKNIEAIAQYFSVNNSDTILIARPLYHCAVLTGEFLVSLFKGVSIVFFDEVYNPMNIIVHAYEHKVTTFCGTPTLLNHISQLVKRSHKELKIKKIAISGECLNRDTANNIRNAFPDAEIYNVYGLTEAAPRVSYLPPYEFDRYPESVGIPLKGVKIKIVDKETGEDLIINNHGIVMVSSPSMMKGYYQNHELTLKAIEGSWLNTHDIGYKDEKGYLYILSRADDMIIKAGMNIYPKEIEDAINSLQEISECLAYGEENDLGKKIAVDIVMCNKYVESDIKALMSKFQEILPPYLMPSKINIVEFIPRNASGKIIRRKERQI